MLLWDEDEYGTVLFHSVIYNSVIVLKCIWLMTIKWSSLQQNLFYHKNCMRGNWVFPAKRYVNPPFPLKSIEHIMIKLSCTQRKRSKKIEKEAKSKTTFENWLFWYMHKLELNFKTFLPKNMFSHALQGEWELRRLKSLNWRRPSIQPWSFFET